MITFYLSRNPLQLYGGNYRLTTYIPHKSPDHEPLCWYYGYKLFNNKHMFNIDLNKEYVEQLVSQINFEILPGTCVNLTTSEVLKIEDAECVLTLKSLNK